MSRSKKHTLILKLILIILIFYNGYSYNQSISINGNVSTMGGTPVYNALITFIEEIDTTKKYSAVTDTSGNYQVDIVTAVTEDPVVPQTIELAQNYPNPFTSETQIPYKLNKQADVSLRIYDILGQEVRNFNIGLQTNGIYGVRWDGRNNFGNRVTPGIYFYQLQTGKETLVKKMVFSGGSTILYKPFFFVSTFKANESENKTKTLPANVTYTCQIRNNDNTNPKILIREINGIQINRDTTINITVIEESSAEGYFPLQIGNEWTFEFPIWTPSSGDTLVTENYNITKKKQINGREYYGFSYKNGMPFFPGNWIIENLDTIFIRQNEEEDIMILVDDSEWLYFTFNTELLDSLIRTKIRNVDYFFMVESFDDKVNTPIGLFDKCYKILNYFPAIKGTEHYIWFAPGYGPVKIYYPELDVTYQLVKINIQNN